jgi:UDP-N-acetylmuramate dehydrogenase
MEFAQNVSLGPMTTLGVGGPSRWFGEIRTENELQSAVGWAEECNLPLFVLGGGSNLVISDRGWPGLTLRIQFKGVSRHGKDKEIFQAGAGEEWDSLVSQTVESNFAGIECLSGIPGSVGGTPVQNVGAYGQDVSETITKVRAFELACGRFVEFTSADCGFAYRSSRFNTVDRGRYIITNVSFALRPGGTPKIEYADLKRHFAEAKYPPTLREAREAVRAIRHSKAMLIVDGDEDCRSAGSFFKNPIVDAATYERLAAEVAGRGLTLPKYPAGDGRVKIAAAWLVEQSGMHKGFALGPVAISRRHALAIVNRGGATASDIIALKDRVQRQVRDAFGIELQPEPVFVGF